MPNTQTIPNIANIQRSLFDGTVLPARTPTTTICAGGCGRAIPLATSIATVSGLMCARCFDDLFAVCADCDRWMLLDERGEHGELVHGNDGNDRCQRCHSRAYMLCEHCGRNYLRSDEHIRTGLDGAGEYCHNCWDSLWFTCTDCGDVYSHNRGHTLPHNDERVCDDCFEVEYCECSSCQCAVPNDEYLGWEGDPYCEECYGRADTWKTQPWTPSDTLTFDRVGSQRSFGVELETSRCDGWRGLHGNTRWGCVYECSTPGREFISPILQGDQGFDDIEDICACADERGWEVDSSCGLHVHIDARDLSSKQLLQVAYAYRRTYPLWKRFVNSDRRNNSMCGSPQYELADIKAAEHFEDFAEARDRFEFVNWRAYLCHGSIEVRVYQGSLDAHEICNWVSIHARFIDAVKDMCYAEIDGVFGCQSRTNWRGLVNHIGEPELLMYWRVIGNRRGTPMPALWLEPTN